MYELHVHALDAVAAFLDKAPNEILGELARSASAAGASLESTQTDAWLEEIQILKASLTPYRQAGSLYFEYSIPRLPHITPKHDRSCGDATTGARRRRN